MRTKKLIATVAVGLVAALVIALVGIPGSTGVVGNAPASAHAAAQAAKKKKKTKKCKKGYVKKHGKCVKKPKPKTSEPTKTTTTPTTTTTTPTTEAKPTAAEVSAGKTLFDATCSACHGMTGEGGAGDGNVPYSKLTRAQTIQGVVEQLTSPDGGMPNYDSKYSTAEKEELGAYVTVELTKTVKVGGG